MIATNMHPLVRRGGGALALGARRTLGVAGVLLAGASVWLGVLNLRSSVVVLVALGVNAAACGLLAYWGLAGPRLARVDPERAILTLAATRGAPLSEAEIALETGLSLAEARAALDRMRRQGAVEIVFRGGEIPAYRVIGLERNPTSEPPDGETLVSRKAHDG
jgi:hypothetical protein